MDSVSGGRDRLLNDVTVVRNSEVGCITCDDQAEDEVQLRQDRPRPVHRWGVTWTAVSSVADDIAAPPSRYTTTPFRGGILNRREQP